MTPETSISRLPQGLLADISLNNRSIYLRPAGTEDTVASVEIAPNGNLVFPLTATKNHILSWQGGARIRANDTGTMVISGNNGSGQTTGFLAFRPNGDSATTTEIQMRSDGNLKQTAANVDEPNVLTRRDTVINLISSRAPEAGVTSEALADLDVNNTESGNDQWGRGCSSYNRRSRNQKYSRINTTRALRYYSYVSSVSIPFISDILRFQYWERRYVTWVFVRSLRADSGTSPRPWFALYHEGNKPNIQSGIVGITIDGNGFVKKASPIAKLIAEIPSKEDSFFWTGVETVGGYVGCNAEAQGVFAVKTGLGRYTIKGSLGWNTEGWKFELPRDDNGNMLCFVESDWNEEEKELNIQVFTRKFDINTGNIIAGEPMEIPQGRWIDLRLEMPKVEIPEVEFPEDPEVE